MVAAAARDCDLAAGRVDFRAMTSPRTATTPAPRRARNLARHFLVANAVYLCIVHVWALGLPATADDLRVLASGATLSARALHAVFGAYAPAYHLLAFALLYAAMAALFFLTRRLVRGPVWLGSLAMAVLMAHPLKNDAVLPLMSAVPLAFFTLALVSMACYVNARPGRVWLYAAALLAFLPLAATGRLLALGLTPLLVEGVALSREERRWWRPLPFLVLAGGAAYAHGQFDSLARFSPSGMFAPLAFIAYPIGFLPETARMFHEQPWLGWAAALAAVVLLALLARAVCRRAFTFGLLAMAAVRLGAGAEIVDPYHLLGGGGLFLSIAFACIAFAAFWGRVMEHPKWGRAGVFLTTAVCLVLFGMQIRAIHDWRRAADFARAFREQARETAEARPGDVLLVLPDFLAHEGAPLGLAESLEFAPGFPDVSVVRVLRLHLPRGKHVQFKLTAHEPAFAEIEISGTDPERVLPWPYTPEAALAPGTAGVVALLPGGAPGVFRLRVTPGEGALPLVRIPFPAP